MPIACAPRPGQSAQGLLLAKLFLRARCRVVLNPVLDFSALCVIKSVQRPDQIAGDPSYPLKLNSLSYCLHIYLNCSSQTQPGKRF